MISWSPLPFKASCRISAAYWPANPAPRMIVFDIFRSPTRYRSSATIGVLCSGSSQHARGRQRWPSIRAYPIRPSVVHHSSTRGREASYVPFGGCETGNPRPSAISAVPWRRPSPPEEAAGERLRRDLGGGRRPVHWGDTGPHGLTSDRGRHRPSRLRHRPGTCERPPQTISVKYLPVYHEHWRHICCHRRRARSDRGQLMRKSFLAAVAAPLSTAASFST